MFSRKDMLPEEEIRQIEERLKVLNTDLDLPKSLSAEELHKRLTAEDCRNFREAGHPDFMYWQRYAGMVASFIVVLMGLVAFTTGMIPLDHFASSKTAEAPAAAEAAPRAEIAAMDMDEMPAPEEAQAEAEETGVVEEELAVEESAYDSGAEKTHRSRLYAADVEDITAALGQKNGANNTVALSDAPSAASGDTKLKTSASMAPEATWQKEFSDVPGEGADVLKSDGTYFYYYTAPALAGQEGLVNIIEAESLNNVASISAGVNDGTELFIRDGRLVVVSQNRRNTAEVLYDASVMVNSRGESVEPAQLQQAAQQRGTGYGVTTVSIYDLTNIAAPTLVRSFMQDGTYLYSRLVGGRLFLFTDKAVDRGLALEDDALLCDTLPVVRDSLSGGSAVVDAQNIAIAPESTAQNYITVSMFDVARDGEVITNSVLGASQTYFSDGTIYFCYDVDEDSIGIMRMAVGLSMDILSQTVVKGSLEEPFAINRFKDILRVGTVTREEGRTYSNVYLLEDSFHSVGSVEGIGSGEQVKSIRFVDDVVYITSQREERPVYALNLSDPDDPVILGQLEAEPLPESFRMIEGSLLIGVKEEEGAPLKFVADDVSSGWVKDKYEDALPGAGGSSTASGDYRALLYNSENRLAGFPVICRQPNGSLQNWGYAVYTVTEEGLARKGIISHAEVLNESIDQQRRSVLRGRVVEDRLYTFSGSMVKAHDITTLREENSLRLA